MTTPVVLAIGAVVLLAGAALASPPVRVARAAGDASARPRGPLLPVLVALAALVAAGPLVALAAGVALLAGRRWAAARRRALRRELARSAAPGALALVGLALRAGSTPALALREAAEHADPVVAGQLDAAGRQMSRGRPATEALDLLAEAWGGLAPRLGRVLDSAIVHGVAVADALDALADEVADERRRRLEARVRRLPVVLLAPLVLCILPAFVLLAVVPFVVAGLGALP